MKPWMDWLSRSATEWLNREVPPPDWPLCDFNRPRLELRPGDVLLVEGRSRVANVIKVITQSPWSHAALYVGRIHEIPDPKLRAIVRSHHKGDSLEPLLIEALMGRGAVVTPLAGYRRDCLRICRPEALSRDDADLVIGHAIRHLGLAYAMRQVLDLARFFFPWGVLPRRWRSSLFRHNAGAPTRTVCSALLAEAFSAVDYPILPFIDRGDDGSLRFFKRNPKLFTPRDFDHSPYFNIVKYPFLGASDLGLYRRLPRSADGVVYNDEPLDLPPLPRARPRTDSAPHLPSRPATSSGTGPKEIGASADRAQVDWGVTRKAAGGIGRTSRQEV